MAQNQELKNMKTGQINYVKKLLAKIDKSPKEVFVDNFRCVKYLY